MSHQNTRQTSAQPDDALFEKAAHWLMRNQSEGQTKEEQEAFQQWLDEEITHAIAYAEAEALWDESTQALQSTKPEDLHQSGDPKRNEVVAFPRRRIPVFGIIGSIAACLILALAFQLWSPGRLTALTADHVTATGAFMTVELEDGSTVELNTDTALSVNFSEGHRQIILHYGEAFFSVRKDPARPFDVVTATGQASALGTAYSVRNEGGTTRVAVNEGTVRLSGLEHPARHLDLAAGGVASLTEDGQLVPSEQKAPELNIWRKGKLVFTDRKLGDVIAELDRYRPGAIIITANNLAHLRFSGSLNLRDTDQALRALELSLGLKAIELSPYLTLLR